VVIELSAGLRAVILIAATRCKNRRWTMIKCRRGPSNGAAPYMQACMGQGRRTGLGGRWVNAMPLPTTTNRRPPSLNPTSSSLVAMGAATFPILLLLIPAILRHSRGCREKELGHEIVKLLMPLP